jgi:starch synthase (maltosyl-transferring)
VVNLDTNETIATTVHLDLAVLGLDPNRPFKVEDLMHGNIYEWRGSTNYVSLNPNGTSLHVFRVEQ